MFLESISTNLPMLCHLKQGSPEWLALRKTKITATDAPIIMGVSPYKTRLQLYKEKVSDESGNTFVSPAMKRGLELEDEARALFSIMTGITVYPAVMMRDWALASLDGIDESLENIVEIKCPGEKDHATALAGKVPEHYYPQLQHQMHVCGVDKIYYFSFDGLDGVVVEVQKDQDYINKLLSKALDFYKCITSKTPPEPTEDDYIERYDDAWTDCAANWKQINNSIKELEKQEDYFRKQLIFLSGESNIKGAGISLCKVKRKGAIDYGKVPQLKGLDLECYRKPEITSWRISCQ